MGKLLRNVTLALLLIGGGLKLWFGVVARAQVEAAVARIAPYASIRHGAVVTGFDGSIRLDDVAITPRLTRQGTITAQALTVHTPGLAWLLARALSGSQAAPDALGLSVTGLQLPAGSLPDTLADWFGGSGQVPFESLGCGVVTHFGTGDYQKIGLAPQPLEQRLDYRYEPASGRLELDLALDAMPLARYELHADLAHWQAPFDAAALARLRIDRLTLHYRDPGYLQRRNRLCAQHIGADDTEFLAQHVGALKALLAAQGIAPSAEVLALYRQFASAGGDLELDSLPSANLVPRQYGELEPAERLRALGLTARLNGAPPILVRIDFVPPTALPPPAPGVAEREAAAAAPAPAPAAAVPTPSTPAVPPALRSARALAGQDTRIERLPPAAAATPEYDALHYAALAAHAGARVRLITRGGRSIEGRVLGADASGVRLQVNVAGGSARISVAAERIQEAQLLRRAGAR